MVTSTPIHGTPESTATIRAMLQSQVCKYEDFLTPEFLAWRRALAGYHPLPDREPPITVHRKMWEWLFTLQALKERGMLEPGKTGIGFGVGKEPLVALFAKEGATIRATDLDPKQARENGWLDSGVEYAQSIEELNMYGLCDPEQFRRLVAYSYIDMNHLPEEHDLYDFSWSSCAFEHLGNLHAGMNFVINQMDFVKPGGYSVHTTEFNVSSNLRTVVNGGTVLYRKRDIEGLAKRLRKLGYGVDLDLTLGTTPDDLHIDTPPFGDRTHLKVRLEQFVTTSVALIIQKPA